MERVRLVHEHVKRYDGDWYREQCIRAAVGILSLVGYRESEIKKRLATRTTPSIQSDD